MVRVRGGSKGIKGRCRSKWFCLSFCMSVWLPLGKTRQNKKTRPRQRTKGQRCDKEDTNKRRQRHEKTKTRRQNKIRLAKNRCKRPYRGEREKETRERDKDNTDRRLDETRETKRQDRTRQKTRQEDKKKRQTRCSTARYNQARQDKPISRQHYASPVDTTHHRHRTRQSQKQDNITQKKATQDKPTSRQWQDKGKTMARQSQRKKEKIPHVPWTLTSQWESRIWAIVLPTKQV